MSEISINLNKTNERIDIVKGTTSGSIEVVDDYKCNSKITKFIAQSRSFCSYLLSLLGLSKDRVSYLRVESVDSNYQVAEKFFLVKTASLDAFVKLKNLDYTIADKWGCLIGRKITIR